MAQCFGSLASIILAMTLPAWIGGERNETPIANPDTLNATDRDNSTLPQDETHAVWNFNVTRGLGRIANNTNWYVPTVSDGQSIFKFGIKHSYNKECASKEDFKRNTYSCLKTHDMFLEDTISTCRIVVTGDQLAKTYKQLFRNYSLLVNVDAHLLTVNTCANKISITDFFVFPKSKESTFKFLPYGLDHFRHMLEFDLSLEDPGGTMGYLSVDVMNSCLPDLSSYSDITASDTDALNCTETKLIHQLFDLYQAQSSGDKEQAEKSRLTFLRKYGTQSKPIPEVPVSKDRGCIKGKNGIITCSAHRHLDRSQRHLYMIAMYVQVYFIAEYLDQDPYDLEVCLVDKMASRHQKRWFYGRLTASSTSKTERFTLIECCSMTRKLKVYDQPNSDMQVSWVCHDPYRVANIILICVNVGSYLAVLLFPLCIKFLPPLRVSANHEGCSKDEKPKKHSRFSLKRKKKSGSDVTPDTGHEGDDNGCCGERHSLRHRCRHLHRQCGDKNDCNVAQSPPSATSPTNGDGAGGGGGSGGGVEGTKTPLLALPVVRVTNEEDRFVDDNTDVSSAVSADGGKPYIPPHDLLFLDSDPVYSFGVKTILSHLLLFHVDCWGLVVFRRFLFLYVMWVLVHFASVIVNFYYPALAVHYQVFSYQFDRRFGFSTEISGEDFHRVFCILVFVVPLCYSTIHFTLLSPLLLKQQPVSKSLSWDDNESHIGSNISMDSQYLFYKKSKPCEVSFLMLLISRLKLVSRKQFWKFLFNKALFTLPKCISCDSEPTDNSSRPNGALGKIGLVMFYFLKLPLVFVLCLIYTIPFFVFHRELLVNPVKFLKPTVCGTSKVMRWTLIVMTVSSMVLSFLLLLSFSFLYGSMAIFVLVDIIRNIKTNVNHGVLIASVLLYVQNALVSLEDEYRYMKRTVFNVCKTLDTQAKEKYPGSPRRPSLVWTSPEGDTAIPRRIFTGVVDTLMPYSTEVLQTSFTLILNLSLVFFLYVLVIDFQALDQFTGIGQSLMTIFTVSLPGLIGKLRSVAALNLDSERMYNKVMASVKDVVDREDVFEACPSQINVGVGVDWVPGVDDHGRGQATINPEWV